jgi:hypothetical protein
MAAEEPGEVRQRYQVPDPGINKITYENATALDRFDPFTHDAGERATVIALRRCRPWSRQSHPVPQPPSVQPEAYRTRQGDHRYGRPRISWEGTLVSFR